MKTYRYCSYVSDYLNNKECHNRMTQFPSNPLDNDTVSPMIHVILFSLLCVYQNIFFSFGHLIHNSNDINASMSIIVQISKTLFGFNNNLDLSV